MAGLGLGYLLATVLTRRRNFQSDALTPATSAPSRLSSDLDLRAAITELKGEVELLRSSVERSIVHLEVEHGIGRRLSSHALTEGTSEFVSARGDDEDADDQFLDLELVVELCVEFHFKIPVSNGMALCVV